MAGPIRDKAAPRRIGVKTFRGNIDAFLREAQKGNTFLVTSRGEVLAEVRPPVEAVRAARTPGALRGRIHMASDFDTLPPDVLEAMQGEERRGSCSTPTHSFGGSATVTISGSRRGR